ncbi:MAG TPA: PepSY domain-containing protein [Steroidobacteraceae bacterium]|nr:PepSY domain-containing protein [Steroidobacteraceae bacterium]
MRLSSLLILCLSLCGTALPVPAAPAQAAMAQTSVSMDQAVKMVEQRFRARVVKAESQRDGARTVYVLRLLNESGRVWTVRVDAASGAIS